MAKLPRYTAQVFGTTAGSNQMSEFGSLAAGTPAEYSGTTITPTIVQALSAFQSGWYSAVLGQNSPTIQDMNSLFYLTTYQSAYILEMGIGEYDSGTTYYQYSVCQYNGTLYQANQTSTGNLPTSTTYWGILSNPSQLVSETAAYSILPSDSIVLLSAASAAFTSTLPTAVGVLGKSYTIKKIDSTSNVITIGTTSAQTIDGLTTAPLNTQDDTIEVISDGANWQVVSNATISAHCNTSTSQSCTSSTSTFVKFEHTDWDTNSLLSTVSSITRFTASKAGKYSVKILLTTGSPGSNGQASVLCRKNGTTIVSNGMIQNILSGDNGAIVLDDVIQLVANDYIEIGVYPSTTVAVGVAASGSPGTVGTQNYFTVHKL
jgi:hypothetical protein